MRARFGVMPSAEVVGAEAVDRHQQHRRGGRRGCDGAATDARGRGRWREAQAASVSASRAAVAASVAEAGESRRASRWRGDHSQRGLRHDFRRWWARAALPIVAATLHCRSATVGPTGVPPCIAPPPSRCPWPCCSRAPHPRRRPRPRPAAAKLSADECAVWARELSFAQSVADHDAAAFAAHLHPDAAFGASRAEPTRGRDAIARRWAGIIEGKAVGAGLVPDPRHDRPGRPPRAPPATSPGRAARRCSRTATPHAKAALLDRRVPLGLAPRCRRRLAGAVRRRHRAETGDRGRGRGVPRRPPDRLSESLTRPELRRRGRRRRAPTGVW